MANPTFQEGALPRRKKPGEALTGQDTLLPIASYGIHNSTPPNLADGDVKEAQLDDAGNLLVALGDPAQMAQLNKGLLLPYHDEQVIDESASPNVTITYKLASVTVATKTITVVGTTTTIAVTVP